MSFLFLAAIPALTLATPVPLNIEAASYQSHMNDTGNGMHQQTRPARSQGEQRPNGSEGRMDGARRPGGPRMNPDRMFQMMDQNKDGVVSRAEFNAAHERMKQRQGQRMDRRGGQGSSGQYPNAMKKPQN